MTITAKQASAAFEKALHCRYYEERALLRSLDNIGTGTSQKKRAMRHAWADRAAKQEAIVRAYFAQLITNTHKDA